MLHFTIGFSQNPETLTTSREGGQLYTSTYPFDLTFSTSSENFRLGLQTHAQKFNERMLFLTELANKIAHSSIDLEERRLAPYYNLEVQLSAKFLITQFPALSQTDKMVPPLHRRHYTTAATSPPLHHSNSLPLTPVHSQLQKLAPPPPSHAAIHSLRKSSRN